MKKKIIGTLSILLFLLLLGYSGTCYAVEKGQVQNLAYNWYTNYMNWSDETTRQFITSKDSGFDNVLDFFNENYGIIALRDNSTEFYVYIVPNNYSTNNQYYISKNNYGWCIWEIGWVRFTSSSISSLKRTSVSGGRCGNKTDVVYTDFPIYNGNNSSSTIVYSAGYHTPDWFNLEGDYYSSYVWQFIQNGTNLTINNERWAYKLIDSSYSTNLGVLTDSVWTQSIEYKIDYYNTNTQKFDRNSGWHNLFDKNKDDTILVKYSNVTTQSNGLYSTTILFDTYKYKDCILSLKIEPWADNDNIFTNLYAFYYIKSNNTYIEGDITYPTLTFSGDYIGDYNNQVNENTEQENDNFWKEAYNDLFTISSGDVNAMLNDFTERINFESYGDVGIEESILGVLEGEPDDFKISWEDIKTPAIANLGLSAITLIPAGEINFSRMTRENEALGRVKGIVNILCSFTLIMMLLKNIWFTLMRVLGVGVDMYESQQEENERLEMVNSETINVNGDTGTYTITKTNYNPRTKQRTNITWKGE